MAAIPKPLAEEGRRSSSSSRKGPLSHGRGGAGKFLLLNTPILSRSPQSRNAKVKKFDTEDSNRQHGQLLRRLRPRNP